MEVPKGIKSIETKYMEERDALFRGLKNLSRRDFLKLGRDSRRAWRRRRASSRRTASSWSTWRRADDASNRASRFAYISDTHLYKRQLNDRFVRAILKAVDDVNALTRSRTSSSSAATSRSSASARSSSSARRS